MFLQEFVSLNLVFLPAVPKFRALWRELILWVSDVCCCRYSLLLFSVLSRPSSLFHSAIRSNQEARDSRKCRFMSTVSVTGASVDSSCQLGSAFPQIKHFLFYLMQKMKETEATRLQTLIMTSRTLPPSSYIQSVVSSHRELSSSSKHFIFLLLFTDPSLHLHPEQKKKKNRRRRRRRCIAACCIHEGKSGIILQIAHLVKSCVYLVIRI